MLSRRSPRVGRAAVVAVAFVAVSLLAAGLSLLLGSSPGSDAWSWLVWGREVRELALDTTGGSSWKPLPVLFTTPISLFGSAAPALWLILVRASWLVALGLAYRVASRLGGRAAGVIAACLLLLTPDPAIDWFKYVARGGSEPLVAALVLGAIERHLAGRRMMPLALGCLAALGRPEAAPLVGLYGVLVWRAEPDRRAGVAAALASVPLLWLGGSAWGAGAPLGAAQRAQEALQHANTKFPGAPQAAPWQRAVFSIAAAVIAPVWLAMLAGVAGALGGWRRGDPTARVTVALGAGVVGWAAIVGAEALLGLPAVSRFMFAAGVVVAVLAAVGLASIARALPGRRARAAFAIVLAAGGAALALPRAKALPSKVGVLNTGARRPQLKALEEADAAARSARCGHTVVLLDRSASIRARQVAWLLHLPLHSVRGLPEGATAQVGRALVVARQQPPSAIRPQGSSATSAPASWRPIVTVRAWTVFEAGCGAGSPTRPMRR